MLECMTSDVFEYEKLSAEEQQKRGILGRLVGVISDFKNPTRNGRIYREELWDKVFDNPIMQEKIENRCLFGELGHPIDGRTEIDMEKIAICMSGTPKKDKDGKLRGVFDILSTPNGKILKTLCDYGCNIGVSSRGSGDTFTDFDGQEAVDPDSYECECWDAVLIPAVKEARLSYVTESIGQKTLKQALTESLKNANENDRRVMQETIDRLNIGYTPEKVDNIVSETSNKSAESNGDSLIDNLQKTLKEKQKLQEQVISLQEKLSVGYSKEESLREELETLKSKVSKLVSESKKVEPLKKKIARLEEQLITKEKDIGVKSRESQLIEKHHSEAIKNNRVLQEQLNHQNEEISEVKSRSRMVESKLNSEKKVLQEQVDSLNDNITALQEEYAKKTEEHSKKLEKANNLVEKYRRVAQTAVDKYISAQATRIGVKASEIKSKLSENYSFSDIDSVCEDLQEYRLNISKLPFDTTKKSNISIQVKESYEPIKPKTDIDDDIDEQLINLANM